jgi:hypothetical protein
VFVNLFVDNAVVCELYPLTKNSCNEMDGVRLQARRIHELQDYLDAQSGGPGKGWFRIVTSPGQARRVINQGKLAVVEGIEVSKLFDCGLNNEQAECTARQIDQRLDEVYDMGVRDMDDRARLAGRQHPARLRPDRDRARLPAGAALQRPRALPARRPPRAPDDRQGHDHRPGPPERAGAPAAARHRRGRGLSGIISSHSWSTPDSIPRIYKLGGS